MFDKVKEKKRGRFFIAKVVESVQREEESQVYIGEWSCARNLLIDLA
jgi:hypothetical protein